MTIVVSSCALCEKSGMAHRILVLVFLLTGCGATVSFNTTQRTVGEGFYEYRLDPNSPPEELRCEARQIQPVEVSVHTVSGGPDWGVFSTALLGGGLALMYGVSRLGVASDLDDLRLDNSAEALEGIFGLSIGGGLFVTSILAATMEPTTSTHEIGMVHEYGLWTSAPCDDSGLVDTLMTDSPNPQTPETEVSGSEPDSEPPSNAPESEEETEVERVVVQNVTYTSNEGGAFGVDCVTHVTLIVLFPEELLRLTLHAFGVDGAELGNATGYVRESVDTAEQIEVEFELRGVDCAEIHEIRVF